MSWKGFQKAVMRAPQQIKGKLNIGENTIDQIYIDIESQFKELEQKLRRLSNNAKRYIEAISGVLDYQLQFSEIIEEIYKPITGKLIETENTTFKENNESIKATKEYQAIIKELQETLSPELEMIELQIIKPVNELLSIVNSIYKVTEKRERKRLDYDRHRSNLKKLQDKKEKTLKDERALYNAENTVEHSTQEFEYYNTLLKEELPILFDLESTFIQPIFQNFYYKQLNIYYTLYEKMKRINISYFNLDTEIIEGFNNKRSNIQEITEDLNIVKFTLSGRPRCISDSDNSKLSKPGSLASQTESNTYSDRLPSYSEVSNMQNFKTQQGNDNIRGTNYGNNKHSNVRKIPPPLPNKPTAFKVKKYAIALYDYQAQQKDDLSFNTGDKIEIIKKTENKNDWWVGKLNGVEGVFPGNYFSISEYDFAVIVLSVDLYFTFYLVEKEKIH
ncbi:hypothetical protein PCANB_001165 [Pneumocystis canis]|nr:hypothetical protein PCK1_001136 [Pneumocystis canis]KAG5437188.1 hypothetical protein PCANB_001165 [Pneumocystis canis]